MHDITSRLNRFGSKRSQVRILSRRPIHLLVILKLIRKLVALISVAFIGHYGTYLHGIRLFIRKRFGERRNLVAVGLFCPRNGHAYLGFACRRTGNVVRRILI